VKVPVPEVGLSPLDERDLEALIALMGSCLERDGGLPLAREQPFVTQRFLAGPGIGIRDDAGSLRAAAALSVPSVGVSAMGVVNPEFRGFGYGSALLDWVETNVGDRTVQLRCETLGEDAARLFAARGYQTVFVERVMRRASAPALPEATLDDVRFESWSDASAPDFYEAYTAAFRERPGFPGWSFEQWVSDLVDEDLNSEESVLARGLDGAPLGFVLVARDWIEQLGVVPGSRRRGLGAALVGRAARSIAGTGAPYVWLNVGENNSGAQALYRQLGFGLYGRRGRFERPRPNLDVSSPSAPGARDAS
jgi:mycothiol synthase